MRVFVQIVHIKNISWNIKHQILSIVNMSLDQREKARENISVYNYYNNKARNKLPHQNQSYNTKIIG